jgi:hypothetical protein
MSTARRPFWPFLVYVTMSVAGLSSIYEPLKMIRTSFEDGCELTFPNQNTPKSRDRHSHIP